MFCLARSIFRKSNECNSPMPELLPSFFTEWHRRSQRAYLFWVLIEHRSYLQRKHDTIPKQFIMLLCTETIWRRIFPGFSILHQVNVSQNLLYVWWNFPPTQPFTLKFCLSNKIQHRNTNDRERKGESSRLQSELPTC